MQFATGQLAALLIFIATYLLLATGYRERTIAAMARVGAIWIFGILTPNEMIAYVDLNAIGLLFGMMILVGALREARFFRWLGLRIAHACRYRPMHLLVVFMLMTAGLSWWLISPILAKVPEVGSLLNLPVSLAFLGLMMLLLYDLLRILQRGLRWLWDATIAQLTEWLSTHLRPRNADSESDH